MRNRDQISMKVSYLRSPEDVRWAISEALEVLNGSGWEIAVGPDRDQLIERALWFLGVLDDIQNRSDP